MKMIVVPIKASRCVSFDNVDTMNSWLATRRGEFAIVIDGEVIGVHRGDVQYIDHGMLLDLSELERKFNPLPVAD